MALPQFGRIAALVTALALAACQAPAPLPIAKGPLTGGMARLTVTHIKTAAVDDNALSFSVDGRFVATLVKEQSSSADVPAGSLWLETSESSSYFMTNPGSRIQVTTEPGQEYLFEVYRKDKSGLETVALVVLFGVVGMMPEIVITPKGSRPFDNASATPAPVPAAAPAAAPPPASTAAPPAAVAPAFFAIPAPSPLPPQPSPATPAATPITTTPATTTTVTTSTAPVGVPPSPPAASPAPGAPKPAAAPMPPAPAPAPAAAARSGAAFDISQTDVNCRVGAIVMRASIQRCHDLNGAILP